MKPCRRPIDQEFRPEFQNSEKPGMRAPTVFRNRAILHNPYRGNDDYGNGIRPADTADGMGWKLFPEFRPILQGARRWGARRWGIGLLAGCS